MRECSPSFQWSVVEDLYRKLSDTVEPYQKLNAASEYGQYWELQVPNSKSGPLKSRQYIARHRSDGFQPHELKIYWNYNQIQAVRTCSGHNPVTDKDARGALWKWPVAKRKHAGQVRFVIAGIQDAVFDVPTGKQAIVLDFADERMPGGYYLEDAWTQEEVILYNSDGYRALLDLKYTMMNGGFMLLEFGVAYAKQVRFFRSDSSKERLTDLIIAACYDLTHREGLYEVRLPTDMEQIRARTLEKFQAIVASAVANTEGNGSDTYLLLGPIGTGAFQNDKKMIAELFFEVLNNPLMDSHGAIRYAFDQIWFVSIDKLTQFEKVFKAMP